jgi:predicted Zn-dependent peptidase
MLLFLVGPVDPEATMELIRENQAAKTFKEIKDIRRFFEEEPDQVAEKVKEVELSVGISKCLFGFKEGKDWANQTGDDLIKQELATQIVLEALVGTSSELYQSLYDDGLIDDSFGYDYSLDRGYGFSMIGGDTFDPDQLLKRIQSELPKLVEQGISEETFERIRKKKIGANLRSLNSPEWIANQFTNYRFNDADLFKIIPLLEDLTVNDINRRMEQHIDWNRFAVSIVRPHS